MAKITMSRGKFNGVSAVANQQGVIVTLAIDPRGSLKKALAKAKGGEVSDAEVIEFKSLVAEVLTPHTSAILLDPIYGRRPSILRAKTCGLLLTYESSADEVAGKGRLPEVFSDWSVWRLKKAAGADAVKVCLYYDPDDAAEINSVKQAFVERVGAECRANDIAFFLEPICYSDTIGDEQSLAFARVKPHKVTKYTREFSLPQYGVDVLMVEVPVNVRYIAGSTANTEVLTAYTREEAKRHLRAAAAEAQKPFMYLSAGVTYEVFCETLELAGEAGTPFSGGLCGRAMWQGGIPEYGRGGAQALRTWLNRAGVEGLQVLNAVMARGAKPWWDFYGGKENIDISG
jgi:tagatose 1,6-diphosphate aldolase